MSNQSDYPIIKIDGSVPYGDLIRDISELLMIEQSELFFENKLNRLLYENLSLAEILEIGKYINPLFKKEYVSICIHLPNQDNRKYCRLQSDLNTRYQLRLRRCQNGGFLIFNYHEQEEFKSVLPDLKKLLGYYYPGYYAGVSCSFENASDFQQSIRQSRSSLKTGRMLNQQWTNFDDLHVYNLLMSIHDNAALKKFYNTTLEPLARYGTCHKVDLIKTIEVYLANDGDYKNAASALKQHENTIRFRINKAKCLLGMEDAHFKFVEQVSLALKARNIEKFAI